MKILVVGAGIGGLAAATALRQHGHEVDVVEIKPEFAVYGVGINQPANSLRALRSLGVLDQIIAVGYQYDTTGFYDDQGDLIVEVPSAMGGDVPANNALSRLDLHRILIGAAEEQDVKVAYGTTMETFSDTGNAVDVQFSDGRRDTYDLVAAFDGIKSSTRRTLFGPEFDAVYFMYNEFKSAMTQKVAIDRLLPVETEGVVAEGASQDFLYEPDRKALLDRLLPLYVQISIFRGLLESVASEHGARMTAMDAATNNAKEMIARLTLDYNRARQAAITKELMEIIGGAEALK